MVSVCLVNDTEMPYVIEKGDNIASVQLLKGDDSICEIVVNVKILTLLPINKWLMSLLKGNNLRISLCWIKPFSH